MTEDEVREIVREELALWKERERKTRDSSLARFNNLTKAQCAADPSDGPLVAGIKAIFRGESS